MPVFASERRSRRSEQRLRTLPCRGLTLGDSVVFTRTGTLDRFGSNQVKSLLEAADGFGDSFELVCGR